MIDQIITKFTLTILSKLQTMKMLIISLLLT